MAGNYWHSSHYQQWLLDKADLQRERHEDLAVLTADEYQKIFMFFANLIQVIGENLKMRQQVIATATIYFKRFYARNSLKCIDPLLMAPTCVFLASKVDEFGVVSNSRMTACCQQVLRSKFTHAYQHEFPYRMPQILECEFYLMEDMDCCLITYHPYRSLLQYIQDLDHDSALQNLSWRIINDSLRTDLPLIYPPYMIALAALHMASVILNKDTKQWFAELAVDVDKLIEITKEMMALYELWKTYDEKKEIASILSKMPHPKTSFPDRRSAAITART